MDVSFEIVEKWKLMYMYEGGEGEGEGGTWFSGSLHSENCYMNQVQKSQICSTYS